MERPIARPRTVLAIGGLDPSGGAGLAADVRAIADHGCHAMPVATAVTAQDSTRVFRVDPVPPDLLRAQLDAVVDDLPVDAVKIGMLAGAAQVGVVVETVRALRARSPALPVVLDPVLAAKAGYPLLDDAGKHELHHLLPLATLVTPNRDEHAALGNLGVPTLIKGGHGSGARVVDRLLVPGEPEVRLSRVRIQGPAPRGTGCTLGSAIAARLAGGEPLVDAVRRAVDYVARRIRGSAGIEGLGSGSPPLGLGSRRR
jgi:hydroxymethylpyrimidine/phosphomethylpyrimidine kinase